MKKKIILLCITIIAIVTVLIAFAVTTSAEVYTGSCGTNVTYTLDISTGLLKIEGTGAMTNYSSRFSSLSGTYVTNAPWSNNNTTSNGGKISYFIKTIEIAEGVTSIGDYAFGYCSNLVNVSIPRSVTYIGLNVFCYCGNLAGVTINEKNDNYCDVEGVIFSKDKKTLVAYTRGSGDKYTIPDGVTSIRDCAFEYGFLSGVIIPNSIRSIGDSAFYDSNIGSATILGNISIMGSYAFGSTPLSSVTIGDGVSIIGDYAFSGCNKLKSITLPDSVETIGTQAFSSCTNLSNITIGCGLKRIGEYAFAACDSLTGLYVSNVESWLSVKLENFESHPFRNTVGSLYIDGVYATNIVVPSSVSYIGDYAFNDCRNIKNVTIENGVTSIGKMAFRYCSALESVTIPPSVTNFGEGPFYVCQNIKTVTVWKNSYAHKYMVANSHYNLNVIVAVSGIEINHKEIMLKNGEKTTLIATSARLIHTLM